MSKFGFSILMTFCLLLQLAVYGQDIRQSVSGNIYDATTYMPLAGAEISINGKNLKANTGSDENGKFIINNVPPGRYNLLVSHISYYSHISSELLVISGQDLHLEIPMIFSTTELKPVEISSEGFVPIKEFNEPLSAYALSVEQTNRIAANYNDPARLATSYPGVVADNDQANNLSVRGNSPNGLIWKIQGMETVNPNHLTNAGTFSDRLTQNGGGVNILSRQLLGNSKLYSSAWSAGHGNALSGVFDIRLRPGNMNRRSYTLQAGLLGIDLAAEGPFKKNSKSSYLVNYRYSTVGLLSVMGVDLGDEEISFQDLSFNLVFETDKAGTFNFFGTGGSSRNIFEADRDSGTWEIDKDRYDINYQSEMGALGLTHKIPLGSKTSLSTSAMVSAIGSTREGDRLNDALQLRRLEYDRQEQMKVTGVVSLNHRIGNSHQFVLNLDAQYQDYNYRGRKTHLDNSQDRILADGSAELYQPSALWRWQIGDKIILNSGLHSMYYSLDKNLSLEPRFALHIKIHPRHQLKFAYGHYSQVQLPGTYFSIFSNNLGQTARPNADLELSKAIHYVAGLSNDLGFGWGINTEIYYQDIFNIPVSINENSSFSALNLLEGYVSDTLINKGSGENYGIEVTLQKQLRNEYYMLMSYAFFNAKYKALDGVERNSRFNSNYAVAYSAGREMDLSNENKNRWLNVNLRIIARGGFRKTPVDEGASEIKQETVFDESKAYEEKFKDYFRMDFSLAFIRNKSRYTRTWAIDIQNVLNTENVAWETWDSTKGSVQTKYQLGIIPILSYRLNF